MRSIALAQPGAYPNTAKKGLVFQAAMQACDALDGVVDGLISNQVKCEATFDPATATVNGAPLRCAGGADTGDTCLSDAQITALKVLDAGARFNFQLASGETGYPGYNVWGSDLGRASASPLQPTVTFLAMGTGPLKRGGVPIVNALFGPIADDEFLLHVKARLDGQGKPAEAKLPLPDGKVDAWGLSQAEDGPLVVLAHRGDELIALGIRPGWAHIAPAGPGTSQLRALRLPNGELWAEWFDPQWGLRHAMIH